MKSLAMDVAGWCAGWERDVEELRSAAEAAGVDRVSCFARVLSVAADGLGTHGGDRVGRDGFSQQVARDVYGWCREATRDASPWFVSACRIAGPEHLHRALTEVTRMLRDGGDPRMSF